MRRWMIFGYGVATYALFLLTFLYAMGWLGNIVVPRSLDGAPGMPFGQALMIDLGLLGLFAVQHSGMARRGFKQWLTRWVPAPAERSTYVLMSSLVLLLMFWAWQPLGGTVWSLESAGGRAVMQTLFLFGWLLVLVATFLINHFDLFGLRQVWLELRGKPYTPLKFGTPGPYRMVRHPLYVGWLFAFWATPVMTASHLLFAVMTTAYILVAIRLEERDLIAHHGRDYVEYRRRVPMLVPSLRRQAGARTLTDEVEAGA